MANHGPSYGLDAELAQKQASKFDPRLEQEAKEWILAVTGTAINDMHEDLKSGIVLCELANKILPGSVKKINRGRMPFVLMENINSFLLAARQIGVPATDLFMTVDLFEAKNMNQVIDTIHALGRSSRNVPSFAGPHLGPKIADRREVEFTEEQLRAGDGIISRQTAGSHGNATSAGQFDRSREISKLKDVVWQ
eukprot:CAMPEP_0184351482 /NCGR_PEP_ID=MMETSP1089-20130417/43652_1 /TAXON_ID=38269 ORGANISM="Gloeochaete wittrockiana, Strain SAG46.84" /NCGR_SAMPLE_ID=MMETSP1089 /ASSEMBLY_ACC=CAM_ASM_000445 /LENGTH=193 /DNA_ID=CAMNT_0026684839 /DNA_START=70 /DNA_END=651 /DNA_ORIENTATION=-